MLYGKYILNTVYVYCTCGVAVVAKSRSFGSFPDRMSLTAPPANLKKESKVDLKLWRKEKEFPRILNKCT